MGGFQKAIVSLPDGGREGRTARGDGVLIHARAEATGGRIGMWEAFIAPGTGPAWHTHTRETEVFRVISGTFRFWCGEDEFTLGPGATITLPPHVPHQWRNVGTETGQLFAIVTPGGFEKMFLEIARTGASSLDDILAIEASLGLVDHDPRLRGEA